MVTVRLLWFVRGSVRGGRRELRAGRSAGFSDRDILDIAEVVGYYAYANRIADGLGIETEPWIPG